MKRLSMVLAPALMTSALLGIGVAADAQSNILTVTSTSPIPKDAARGTEFTLQFNVNPATAGSELTRALLGFAYDSSYIEVLGNWDINEAIFTEDNPPATALRVRATRTAASGDFAGRVLNFDSFIPSWPGGTSGPRPVLNGDVLLATLNIRLRQDAPGGFADFGIGFTAEGEGLLQANQTGTVFNNQRTGVNTFINDEFITATDVVGGNFALHGLDPRDGGFRVGVVPGPSSLAVFALGGLVPVVGLIRRRRAAK
jgi:hypothetical protein